MGIPSNYFLLAPAFWSAGFDLQQAASFFSAFASLQHSAFFSLQHSDFFSLQQAEVSVFFSTLAVAVWAFKVKADTKIAIKDNVISLRFIL
ncbi:MAG TPA: hypothetical protein VK152_04360 [Paludibacter sp.]|nr:hypothetical protein [Paludibacter sp.]